MGVTIEIALDPGECATELIDGSVWISVGEHMWIDNKCECGITRHETNGNYWYSRGM